jgi:hemerythrin-like domain-containing protein
MERKWNELLMDDHQTTEKVLVAMENVFAEGAAPDRRTVAVMLDYFSVYVDQCHSLQGQKRLLDPA